VMVVEGVSEGGNVVFLNGGSRAAAATGGGGLFLVLVVVLVPLLLLVMLVVLDSLDRSFNFLRSAAAAGFVVVVGTIVVTHEGNEQVIGTDYCNIDRNGPSSWNRCRSDCICC
jgi:hypothetical protein